MGSSSRRFVESLSSPDAARGVCSRVPSGLRTTHASPTGLMRWRPSCSRMWWRWHNRARLSALVGPPSAQCLMWWASQRDPGASQPGHTQPPSRAMRTQRSASLTRRVRRPTSMTRPLLLSTVGMISASQAIRRTVAAERVSPLSVMPASWSPSSRASRLVLTRSTGRTRLPSSSKSAHPPSSRSLPSRSPPSGSLPSRSPPSGSLPSRSPPSGSLPSRSPLSGFLPSRSPLSGFLPSRSPLSGFLPSRSPLSGFLPSRSPLSGFLPSRSPLSGFLPSRSPLSGFLPSRSPLSGFLPSRSPLSGFLPSRSPLSGFLPSRSPLSGFLPSRSPLSGFLPSRSPLSGFLPSRSPPSGSLPSRSPLSASAVAQSPASADLVPASTDSAWPATPAARPRSSLRSVVPPPAPWERSVLPEFGPIGPPVRDPPQFVLWPRFWPRDSDMAPTDRSVWPSRCRSSGVRKSGPKGPSALDVPPPSLGRGDRDVATHRESMSRCSGLRRRLGGCCLSVRHIRLAMAATLALSRAPLSGSSAPSRHTIPSRLL